MCKKTLSRAINSKEIPTCKYCDLGFQIRFASLMNLVKERIKKLIFFTRLILIKINCDRKLFLNKLTYFDDLVFHFDMVYDIIEEL